MRRFNRLMNRSAAVTWGLIGLTGASAASAAEQISRRGNHRHGHAPRPGRAGRPGVGRSRRSAGIRGRRPHLAQRRAQVRAGRELQRRRRAGAGLDHDARRRQHLLDALGRHLSRRHSVRLGHGVRRRRELRARLAARQRRAHRSDQGTAGHAVRRRLDGRLAALHHEGAVADRVRRTLLDRPVRYGRRAASTSCTRPVSTCRSCTTSWRSASAASIRTTTASSTRRSGRTRT